MASRNLFLKLATLSLLAACTLADERVHSSSSRSCATRKRSALRPELKSSALSAPVVAEHGQLARKLELARTLKLQGGSKCERYGQLKIFAAFAVWYLMSIVYSILNKQARQRRRSLPPPSAAALCRRSLSPRFWCSDPRRPPA